MKRILLVSAILISASLPAQDFVPDTSFGTNGRAFTETTSAGTGKWLLLQPDGKIVLAGHQDAEDGDQTVVLTRYESDGAPDLSFGYDGIAYTGIYNADMGDYAPPVALQADGKILVASVYHEPDGGFYPQLMRLFPNGQHDAAFSTPALDIDGIQFGHPILCLQPDGKILYGMGCNQSQAMGGSNFSLYRLNADGSVDTSFGTSGFAQFNIGVAGDSAALSLDKFNTLNVLPDGRILMGGSTRAQTDSGYGIGNFAMICLTPAGLADPDFGTDGRVITTFEEGAELACVRQQPDGKIVAVGRIWYNDDENLKVAVARYLGDGTLDTAYGTSGRVVAEQNAQTQYTNSAEILPDGKLLAVTGIADFATFYKISLLKLNTDGTPDTTFGPDGFRTVEPAAGVLEAHYSSALQPDGKLITGGTSLTPTGAQGFQVIRYADAAMGVHDMAGEIGLAPNPFTEKLQVDVTDIVHATLIGMTGKVVFFVGRPASDGESTTLDMSGLVPGLYMLRIVTPSAISTHKVIRK